MPDSASPETLANCDAVHMRGVEFAWPGRTRFEIAIPHFSIHRGERLLLLGPSGSGKSTLLALLCGVASSQRGVIEVLGHDIAAMRGPVRDRFRGEHYGVIFQMFNLLPYASALDNVLLALNFAPRRRARVAAEGSVRREAARLLSTLEIDGNAVAASLSVGQQQRVAVARALIGTPELIVADEPTSALDTRAQETFLDLLFDRTSGAGTTLVTVSHDERLAPRFDRTTALDDIATVTRRDRP